MGSWMDSLRNELKKMKPGDDGTADDWVSYYRNADKMYTNRFLDLSPSSNVSPRLDASEQKNWFMNWLNHPETAKRLQQNIDASNIPVGETYDTADARDLLGVAKNNIANTREFYVQSDKDKMALAQMLGQDDILNKKQKTVAEYYQNAPVIAFAENYRDAPGTPAHEYAHATRMDQLMGTFMKEAAQRQAGESPQPRSKHYDKRYLDNPQEWYGRLMGMRYNFGIKPGQKFTIDQVNELRSRQNPLEYTLFDSFNPEQVMEILNTIASNKVQDDRSYT